MPIGIALNYREPVTRLASMSWTLRPTGAPLRREVALGSPIQTLGTRSPPDARKYISGYEQLSKHGVGFYPIHRDKSPAVEGKLDRVVTVDPIKIRFWA